MKKLKRMLLIHWHNYEKELIAFDMINFLTGKTAAGKSTIIDALQLVLLGDTTGTFFNKAANTKSARTLKSYLFGEMGDDGDVGFRYMRNERFTSYVALEFEDTERKNCFTTGIVCDCYKDQSFDFKWFVLHNQGFPDNLFVDEMTNVPYDIAGLKTFLTRWLGRKKSGLFEFYDTNKRYQEVTLGKFGQMKNKYRTLLKKAVPFSPIADIEKFITESICDVKNNIQVEQMQSDIRQYKNLEEDARRTQERIEKLKEISSINQEYEKEKEKYQQQNYIVIRAEKEEYIRQEERYKKESENKQAVIAQNEEAMEFLEKECDKVKKELEKLENEYRVSGIGQRERELNQQLEHFMKEIKSLEKKIHDAFVQIQHYGKTWKKQLERAEHANFEIEEAFYRLTDEMSNWEEERIVEFPFEQAMSEMSRMQQEINDYRAELKKRAEQLREDMDNLEATIANLKKGIKPFPDQVVTLKRLLEEELFAKYKKMVDVFILADLLEIKDASWRNAIEGYLDKQKFYLLVPEMYYRDALRIYDRERREKAVYDAGLVDIGKLRKNFSKKPLSGSLAEEIETTHPDARLYADYLLGGVMKCSDVEELNQFKIAITKSCMLYKGYVSRKLSPARYATPFIGRRSMELMLQQKAEELEKQKQLFDETAGYHRIMLEVSQNTVLGKYEAWQHQESVKQSGVLLELKQKKEQVQSEYNSLDFLYLDRMKEKLTSLKESYEHKKDERHELDKQNGVLRSKIESIQQEKLPEVIGQINEVQSRIKEEFEQNWMTEIGEVRFREAQKEDLQKSVPMRERYYAAMKQTEKKRDSLKMDRARKRQEYNNVYKMPYDIQLESNRYFDKELEELEQIRLPEYIEKIVDSKEKSYNQFRDDFIAKIKSNIEDVSRQVEELNVSLRQSVFGTDRYRFVKNPRPEYRNYYDMIMDPLLMDTGGWNIASQSFNEKYQKEINELFQLLILNETNVTAERREEYEKSIRKFTDYKTYLVFDLIVTDENGEEQRLSKTLLKKSGGETQIPFYIALLASFSQVCRIRNKSQNNTLRIIILDEAFSKMDGERIRESIHLLRRFGLQAIFSAPPDKIPDIAPLVDRNIAVYRDGRHSFTRNFDPKEIEDLAEE